MTLGGLRSPESLPFRLPVFAAERGFYPSTLVAFGSQPSQFLGNKDPVPSSHCVKMVHGNHSGAAGLDKMKKNTNGLKPSLGSRFRTSRGARATFH
jgi:hypothetical protein